MIQKGKEIYIINKQRKQIEKLEEKIKRLEQEIAGKDSYIDTLKKSNEDYSKRWIEINGGWKVRENGFKYLYE